jgi:beta-N-acetylhexosaminidase
MSRQIDTLAHAVLLPAVAGLDVDALAPLLDRGCRAVLLGETRAEYLAREMSAERVAEETREAVQQVVAELQAHTDGALLVAVDHEVVGIRRFAHLLPPDVGHGLRELGVNVVLGPIVDVVRGPNPWLAGRNLGSDPEDVAFAGRAAVEELQAAGVAAVAKHYPGHSTLVDDPAVSPAVLTAPLEELPFAAVIDAGVRGIMLGPAVVVALDPSEAASCSTAVVRRIREQLGFEGTLVSDDLDAAGILRGRTVGEAAVASLSAGADLLLVGAEAAPEAAAALAAAVPEERLAEAAHRVGQLVMD